MTNLDGTGFLAGRLDDSHGSRSVDALMLAVARDQLIVSRRGKRFLISDAWSCVDIGEHEELWGGGKSHQRWTRAPRRASHDDTYVGSATPQFNYIGTR
jgi:hypothetical protein